MKTLRSIPLVCAAALGFAAFAEKPDSFIRYIETNGKQYLDTGVIGKTGTKVEIGLLLVSHANGEVYLGSNQGADSTAFYMLAYNYGFRNKLKNNNWGNTDAGKTPRITIANSVETVGTAAIDLRYLDVMAEIEAGCQTITTWTANGSGTATNMYATSFDSSYNMYLFAANNKGGETPSNQASAAQCYYLRIYQKDASGVYQLVRDFRPCLKGGRAGLYDAIDKEIHYSLSDDDFVFEKVWTVYPEETAGKTPGQQIIDALNGVNHGDTILFKPGTYRFADDEYMTLSSGTGSLKDRMSIKKSNLLLRGETSTARKTWTNGSEPVIIDANKGRHVRLSHSNMCFTPPTFEHLTFANADGSTLTGGGHESRGGIYCASSYSETYHVVAADPAHFTNCVLRDSLGCSAAAVYFGRLSDCLVTNCANVAGGSYGGCVNTENPVVDCDFVGNRVYASSVLQIGRGNGTGTGDVDVRRCRIAGNRTDESVKYANAGVLVLRGGRIVDSTFAENVIPISDGTSSGALCVKASYASMTNSPGGCLLVSNCVFAANMQNGTGATHGGAVCAKMSSVPDGVRTNSFVVLQDCQIRRNLSCVYSGGIYNCTATNCVFEDNGCLNPKGFGYYFGGDAELSYLVDCDLTGGEIVRCTLTRCTVHDVTNRWLFCGGNGSFATNCLFYGNRLSSALMMTYGSSAKSEFVNCTFVANSGTTYSSVTNLTAVNCAFFANTNSSGVATDISWADATAHNLSITFTNCAFGVVASGVEPIYGVDNMVNVGNPRFVGGSSYAEKYPDEPFYALRPSSPLCGKGLLLGGTDADSDLAGRPRVRDGKVDIGCYQCWLNPVGLLLLLR